MATASSAGPHWSPSSCFTSRTRLRAQALVSCGWWMARAMPGAVLHFGRTCRLVGHDAQDRALGVPPADGEIQPAVGPDVDIGTVQRPAFEKQFAGSLVGSPVALEHHGQHAALRPVADEEGVLIFLGVAVVLVEHHAGRRAAADVEHGRQAVDVIGRPLRPAAAPAELGAGNQVVHPRRPVPGEPHVPLHVRVVGKQLAVAVEGVIVGVAKSAHEQLHEAAVGVGADDDAAGGLDARGVAVGVLVLGLEQLAVVEMMMRAGRCQLPFDERVVAEDDVDQAVGTEDRRVGPVLAHAAFELESVSTLSACPSPSVSLRR